jgi:small subunit ribosomal protein S14
MAKVSMINRQKKREKMVEKFKKKREELKGLANNEALSNEERFKARLSLAKLPRNSSPTRLHSRCILTGRPKGYYRKLKVSRIALRELASSGEIPGMIKSSW